MAGTVKRQTGQFLGVQFSLAPTVERDLLIRKMFTAGRDTASIGASSWSATGAMLKSIWALRTEMPQQAPAPETTPDNVVTLPVEKLPARSLVVSPRPQAVRLSELVEQRRAMAM